MNKAFIVFAFIILATNPRYNIDTAHIVYTASLSTTATSLTLSLTVDTTIDVDPAGTADIDISFKNMPANFTGDVPEELNQLIILTTTQINAKQLDIEGNLITLQEGKETGFGTMWYGANLLYASGDILDIPSTIKWNKATGILLYYYARWPMANSTDDLLVTITYQSSDIDIYSDQNIFEKFGNQLAVFFSTPLGIVILIIIIAAVVIIITYVVIKNKKSSSRSKKSRAHVIRFGR